MIFYLRRNKDVVDIQLDVLNGLGAINRWTRSQSRGVGGVSVVLSQKNTSGSTFTNTSGEEGFNGGLEEKITRRREQSPLTDRAYFKLFQLQNTR